VFQTKIVEKDKTQFMPSNKREGIQQHCNTGFIYITLQNCFHYQILVKTI